MSKTMLRAGCSIAALFAILTAASASETIRIAEHRQARIDALKKSIPGIEAKLGVHVEVVEYPAPEKDYFSKLLTELGAGNAPDLFTANTDGDVPDLVAAGYLAPVTAEVEAWSGYNQLFDVAKKLSTAADGKMYQLDSMLAVTQLYYRRDLLQAAGISTEQPQTWADLLSRAREIKKKTGKYGLLLPAGTSWGSGAFDEAFKQFIVGSKTPQIANADGTLDLTGPGVTDLFGLWKSLIDDDLMPVEPLLGPEPWVIPKYDMFPAGKLVATTCGSWCYIYDWGPKSKNPIPDVTDAVGTWKVPGEEPGNLTVSVGGQNIWLVNAKSDHTDLAKKVMLELASVKTTVDYAGNMGNLPARKDAGDDPAFQALKALVPVYHDIDAGTFLRPGEGFSVVTEGIGRATEALLRKTTDAPGAQKILVDYARNLLGDDKVK